MLNQIMKLLGILLGNVTWPGSQPEVLMSLFEENAAILRDMEADGSDLARWRFQPDPGEPFDPRGLDAERREGLTGIWLESPPRKIASIGIHISKWVTTHGYALNVDLDPAPFTEWITACGLEDAAFTTIARELERPVPVNEVVPHAVAALEDVFSLRLEPARELVA